MSPFALVLALTLSSPTQAEQPALPAEAEAVWQAMNQVGSLQARFTQRRSSSLLQAPLISTGQLQFQRPDKLAWIVETPGRSLMVVDGSTVGLSYPDLGVQETMDLAGDPDAERLVRSMMVWLAGDLQQVLADYQVHWSSAGAEETAPGTLHRATLQPRDPTMAALVSSLELCIGGDPLRVLAVAMLEPDGDRVDIKLHDVQLDPQLSAGAFSLSGGS